jgi:hypothetical protein
LNPVRCAGVPSTGRAGDAASGAFGPRRLFCWTDEEDVVDEDGIPIGERLFGSGPDGSTRITLAEEGAA